MKKVLAILLTLTMVMALLTACGGNNAGSTGNTADTGDSGDSGKASGLKVALIYSGFLGDKSFNDSAHEGALRAVEDFGIELKELES